MITDDGWFDWMERMPGPPAKVWPGTFNPEGVVLHSAVGTLQGTINVVMGPTSNERSVTGVFGYKGRAIQFYSIFAAPWANGQRSVNQRFRGFEHEGGIDTPATVSEPFTPEQVACDVRMMKDLRDKFGVFWRRPTASSDLLASAWEHKEMTRFGALGTACPSGRVPWQTIFAGLNETPKPVRSFVWGDELAGLEHRGLQFFEWFNGVDTDAIGTYDGTRPGAHYHRYGPDLPDGSQWREILP